MGNISSARLTLASIICGFPFFENYFEHFLRVLICVQWNGQGVFHGLWSKEAGYRKWSQITV